LEAYPERDSRLYSQKIGWVFSPWDQEPVSGHWRVETTFYIYTGLDEIFFVDFPWLVHELAKRQAKINPTWRGTKHVVYDT